MGRLAFTRDVEQGWANLRPNEDLLPLAVIQRLVWSGRLAEGLMQRVATTTGLRHRGDYEVLALLRRSEPESLMPAQIASQLLTSASGMTGKLDRLESQGFLERNADPNDRRIVKLVLTDAGRTVVDDVFTNNLSMYRQILQELDELEQQTLHETLARLLDRMDELTGVRYPWAT